jgi:hypothetical protein
MLIEVHLLSKLDFVDGNFECKNIYIRPRPLEQLGKMQLVDPLAVIEHAAL